MSLYSNKEGTEGGKGPSTQHLFTLQSGGSLYYRMFQEKLRGITIHTAVILSVKDQQLLRSYVLFHGQLLSCWAIGTVIVILNTSSFL